MTDDLEQLAAELKVLEEDYLDAPSFIRRRDLPHINALRERLGLPEVDARLQPLPAAAEAVEQAPEPTQPAVDVHAAARALYQEYLAKLEFMRPHREYCARMLRATAPKSARTPVMPLATMGTDGGPLLCDVCERQFPLEGGQFNRVLAGDAWRQVKNPGADWYSFVSGHVTFLQETNGTFRAYHGDMGRGCGGTATATENKNRSAHEYRQFPIKQKQLRAFFEEELGLAKEARETLLRDLSKELCSYDPGIGVNRP